MRRNRIFFAVLLGVLGLAKFAVASPNIVLILTDDHGWSQTSQVTDPRVPASISRYLETPNMNRLAKEGMRFTSGYSPAPLEKPFCVQISYYAQHLSVVCKQQTQRMPDMSSIIGSSGSPKPVTFTWMVLLEKGPVSEVYLASKGKDNCPSRCA